MQRRSFLLIAAALPFVAPPSARASPPELRIVGSGDGMEMLDAVAREYMAANPGRSVVVPPSIGTGGGFMAVATEKALLGRIARLPNDEEKAQGLVATPLVQVPIAIFAHPSTGVKALTSAQVVDIFSGKVRNWQEVGGADKPVRVVRRDLNDATTVALRAAMPGWKDLVFSERAKQTLSTTEMQDSVRTTEGAIGFCPYAKPIEGVVNYIKVDGLGPTDPGWSTHVQLSLVHKTSTIDESAKAFLAFAATARAKAVLRAHGGKVD